MAYQLSSKELKILNSKKGIKQLIITEGHSVTKAVRYIKYEARVKSLQEELIKLQQWVSDNNKKVVILFEGRDAAGKGGAIRRITQHLNPREFSIVALPKPTEEEQSQWYFQRYINKLPQNGKIVFFDRSWYNRAVVEPVNGFCTENEYNIFMNQVNEFERMIIESGIHLIKIYFSITKEEQARRFEDIKKSPVKKWKFSAVDRDALRLWDRYTDFKSTMFDQTNTERAPWYIIKANKKTKARIESMEKILELIPYIPKDADLITHISSDQTASDTKE
ncbi:MAG: polyphosphate kinase 2 [Bacteroidia bacterium]|nr:polyphosphate kinase 2 [Bacteroidia bacterium]NNF31872.1 polyphosphate kinase 2 [Flavobacteriaceae bacterium]NNJ82701.1 polyphosphate kinase 2 [Flavobacteriaceae bacterium]NNK53048.1 polyphosphate kinase 2 [Flavobacteriaceae bacterium]NNM07749.1 polyphosphate kinase 2 [Flavobacteriaceae bacterium]